MNTDPNDDTDLNKPVKKDFILLGKKFFAHYRFSLENHAEILSSKGKAGIGNNFFIECFN